MPVANAPPAQSHKMGFDEIFKDFDAYGVMVPKNFSKIIARLAIEQKALDRNDMLLKLAMIGAECGRLHK